MNEPMSFGVLDGFFNILARVPSPGHAETLPSCRGQLSTDVPFQATNR
jgi:hypothetical protein